MAFPLSARHLSAQEGGYEPQRANNGMLIVPGVGEWDNTAGVLALSLRSFDLPGIDIGRTESRWNGQVRKFAGNVDFPDIVVRIHDMANKPTYGALWTWLMLVHRSSGLIDSHLVPLNLVERAASAFASPRAALVGTAAEIFTGRPIAPGGRGRAATYKRIAWAFLHDPSGKNVRAFEMQGVWPRKFVPGRVDYYSEDVLTGDLTLSIDLATYLPLNFVPDDVFGAFEQTLENLASVP